MAWCHIDRAVLNPEIQTGQRQRRGHQLRRPTLVPSARLNIRTQFSTPPPIHYHQGEPNSASLLLRHQKLMQNSHSKFKFTISLIQTTMGPLGNGRSRGWVNGLPRGTL